MIFALNIEVQESPQPSTFLGIEEGSWSDWILCGILIAFIMFALSRIFSNKRNMSAQIPATPKRQAIEKRDFTRAQLREYDGTNPTLPILLAVKGNEIRN